MRAACEFNGAATRWTAACGRHVVATRPLRPGDVVLREAPPVFVTTESAARCPVCLCAMKRAQRHCSERCSSSQQPGPSRAILRTLAPLERLALQVAIKCALLVCRPLSPLDAARCDRGALLLRRATAADYDALASLLQPASPSRQCSNNTWVVRLPQSLLGAPPLVSPHGDDAMQLLEHARRGGGTTFALHCTSLGRAIGAIGVARHRGFVWLVVRRDDLATLCATARGESILLAEALNVFVSVVRALGEAGDASDAAAGGVRGGDERGLSATRDLRVAVSPDAPLDPACAAALRSAGFDVADGSGLLAAAAEGVAPGASLVDVTLALELAALVGGVHELEPEARAALEAQAARVHATARSCRVVAAASQLSFHLCQLQRNAIGLTELATEPTCGGRGVGGAGVERYREVRFGSALCVRASMLNHSCAPSATLRFDECDVAVVDDGARRPRRPPLQRRLCVAIVVLKALDVGDEVTISYVGKRADGAARPAALEELSRQYRFTCRCERCSRPAPVPSAAAHSQASRDAAVLREVGPLLDSASGSSGEECARRAAAIVSRHLACAPRADAKGATLARAELWDALSHANALLGDRGAAADACATAVGLLERVYDAGSARCALGPEYFKLAGLCFNAQQRARALSAIEAATAILTVSGGSGATEMLGELAQMRRYLQ